MRVVKFFTESRGSAVKIRRNSHYGKSPIAYPLKSALLSWAIGDVIVAYFLCAQYGCIYFLGGKLCKGQKVRSHL